MDLYSESVFALNKLSVHIYTLETDLLMDTRLNPH